MTLLGALVVRVGFAEPWRRCCASNVARAIGSFWRTDVDEDPMHDDGVAWVELISARCEENTRTDKEAPHPSIPRATPATPHSNSRIRFNISTLNSSALVSQLTWTDWDWSTLLIRPHTMRPADPTNDLPLAKGMAAIYCPYASHLPASRLPS